VGRTSRKAKIRLWALQTFRGPRQMGRQGQGKVSQASNSTGPLLNRNDCVEHPGYLGTRPWLMPASAVPCKSPLDPAPPASMTIRTFISIALTYDPSPPIVRSLTYLQSKCGGDERLRICPGHKGTMCLLSAGPLSRLVFPVQAPGVQRLVWCPHRFASRSRSYKYSYS
jgi:hypothetical protein